MNKSSQTGTFTYLQVPIPLDGLLYVYYVLLEEMLDILHQYYRHLLSRGSNYTQTRQVCFERKMGT
jgi:hypothetical protein